MPPSVFVASATQPDRRGLGNMHDAPRRLANTCPAPLAWEDYRRSRCRSHTGHRTAESAASASRRLRALTAYLEGTGRPEETKRGMAAAAEPARGRWGSLRFRALPPVGTQRPIEIVRVGDPRPFRMPIDSDPSDWSRSPPKPGRFWWLHWGPDRRNPGSLASSPARSRHKTLHTAVLGRLVALAQSRRASEGTTA